MTATQQDLFDTRPSKREAELYALAEFMETLLYNSGRWLTRADLKAHGLSERDCRHGCEYAEGGIVYGQSGYKSTRLATTEELDHCINDTGSREAAMRRKRMNYLRWKHGRTS